MRNGEENGSVELHFRLDDKDVIIKNNVFRDGHVAIHHEKSGSIIEGNYWTVAGCWSTKPELFVKSILSIVFGISGGLAFLAFIGGSIMVLTSSGDPEKLNNGKSIVVSSIFGLLLIVFSVFLLRFVGVEILRLPWFG